MSEKLLPEHPDSAMMNAAVNAWYIWKSRDNGGCIQELGRLMWEHMTDAYRRPAPDAVADQASAQPVAWRYRESKEDRWRFTRHGPDTLARPLPFMEPLYTHPAPQAVTRDESEQLASMTRMFHAACADLGLINEALGLDPDEGGAEPILAAIAVLKERSC